MSQQQNIAIAQTLLEGIGTGRDADEIAAAFAEDLLFEIQGDTDAMPWIGRKSGRQALADFLRTLRDLTEPLLFEVEDILANDARAVIVGALQTRIKATGNVIATQFAIVLTVRNGVVTRFQMLEDSFACPGQPGPPKRPARGMVTPRRAGRGQPHGRGADRREGRGAVQAGASGVARGAGGVSLTLSPSIPLTRTGRGSGGQARAAVGGCVRGVSRLGTGPRRGGWVDGMSRAPRRVVDLSTRWLVDQSGSISSRRLPKGSVT